MDSEDSANFQRKDFGSLTVKKLAEEAVKSFKVQESKIVGNLLFKFIVHKIVTEAHLMEKLLRDSNGGQLSLNLVVQYLLALFPKEGWTPGVPANYFGIKTKAMLKDYSNIQTNHSLSPTKHLVDKDHTAGIKHQKESMYKRETKGNPDDELNERSNKTEKFLLEYQKLTGSTKGNGSKVAVPMEILMDSLEIFFNT